MNVTINSKNIKPGDKLSAAIENKLAKLDKYFSQDTNAVVMLSEEKAGLAKLEATIKVGSLTFRAEESNADLFYCLDKVIDKLSSQMSKQKSKLVKRHKDTKGLFVAEIPDALETAEEKGLVRTKDVNLDAMTTDDAIMQMELLGHTFFIYKDIDTDAVNVIYKRTNGGYGLIKTK